jgi:uncharacterized protein HemX
MNELLKFFDAEHFFTTTLYLIVVVVLLVILKNWGDIRDYFNARREDGKEVKLAQVQGEQEQTKRITELVNAIGTQTLQLVRTESQLNALAHTIERLIRRIDERQTNGFTE